MVEQIDDGLSLYLDNSFSQPTSCELDKNDKSNYTDKNNNYYDNYLSIMEEFPFKMEQPESVEKNDNYSAILTVPIHESMEKNEVIKSPHGDTIEILDEKLTAMYVKWKMISESETNLKKEIDRLLLLNRSLVHKFDNLHFNYAALEKEKSRLQNRHDMLKCAAMKQKYNADEDDDISTQYFKAQLDLNKSIIDKETLFRQVSILKDDLAKIGALLALHQTLVPQLQQRVSSRDNVIQQLMKDKALNITRDIHARLLHNELLNLRGGVRVIVRCLQGCDAENRIEIVNMNVLSIRRPLDEIKTNKSKVSYENITVFSIHRQESPHVHIFHDIKDYVTACIDGHTACIVAHGPKGTGKTHTMMGPADDAGLIPRALTTVMQECADRSPLWTYTVSVGAIQIVNEEIYDLLNKRHDVISRASNSFVNNKNNAGFDVQRVMLHDDGSSIHLRGLTEEEVTSEEMILETLCRAWQSHTTSFYAVNAHFIILVRIKAEANHHLGSQLKPNSERQQVAASHGFLMLCDLASFDKRSQDTDPAWPSTSKLRNKTSLDSSAYCDSNMDTSGIVFCRVFNALRHNTMFPNNKLPVPYRDSKLTHLLKPALSQDAKCALITTVSLAENMFGSSYRTLKLAAKATKACLEVKP